MAMLSSCGKEHSNSSESTQTATTAQTQTGTQEASGSQDSTPIVKVENAQIYSPSEGTDYSASVNPARQLDVCFKGAGYVDSILMVTSSDGSTGPAQEGDFVRRGAVLARLRQSDYAAKVREAAAAADEIGPTQEKTRAALAEAQAALDSARETFARTEGLYHSKSATRPDYESAKTNVKLNEARVQQAKAQLAANSASERRLRVDVDEARIALSDTVLRAPMDGIITKRYIEIGSLVNQGGQAFRIADANSVKVSFGVPDTQLEHLKMGEAVTITSEALPGQTFNGHVTQISPQADQASRVFNVEVTVPNPKKLLKIGMVTTLAIGGQAHATPALAVPMSAVVRSTANDGKYSVFVIRKQGDRSLAEEREVTVGQGYGRLITVQGGIKSGDQVVTTGNTRIVNGQEVRITD